MVTFVVRIRYVMLLIFVGALAATVYTYNRVPTAFVPQEDQAYFLIIVQTPPGASLSYTTDVRRPGAAVVRKNDDVFGTFSVMGFRSPAAVLPTPASSSSPLKPIDERTARGTTIPRQDHRPRASAPNSSAYPVASPSPLSLPPCRHRHLRRIPVHPSGWRAQHLRRHRPRRPHRLWRKPAPVRNSSA